ncbi:non-canonical purine NTP pyrophosphatase [Bacillus sp. AK031]
MKEIVFVTTNKGKVAAAQKELKDIKVLPVNEELVEPRSDDIKEIAKQKVMQAYEIVKRPCIALDSGFYISQLNGFPRAYVNHMLDTIGIDGCIKLMRDESNRECEFRSCLAYFDGEEIRYFESKSPGILAEEIRGTDNVNKWSDLWYIFIPQHFTKTLVEFSDPDFTKYNELKEDSGLKKFGAWYIRKIVQ